MAGRVAEAVLKFELLSTDTNSKVKLRLPELDSSTGRDSSTYFGDEARFPGAFVLYNYARMATILKKHQQLVDKGTYPALPDSDKVDFKHLSDELEWQLVFQYVMRFPEVVQEAAHLKRKGIHVQMSVKKVCLFLVNLSHLFSSYYSRMKILLPPELHLLPLIHARLHLVIALKQVVLNGLTLLGIKPLDEL